MAFHDAQTGLDIHALTANPSVYADIAARDADSAFHSDVANIDKLVRVESPLSFYILGSVAPAWVELSNIGSDDFTDLIDTPASYAGAAGQVLQVDGAEGAVEFGQKLRTTDSPQFVALALGNDGITVGASVPFSDAAGVLTLQNVDALDAVTEAAIELAIDQLANLTSIQGQAISLSGPLTVGGASFLDQDLRTTGLPVFARIDVDNLRLDGNVLSSLDTDGDILLSPNGLGSVLVSKDLVVSGNFTVQGMTTFLDSETLQIEDKNIELGKVAVPTDITADGGGITLKATVDLTILWLNATNAWTFNQSIDLLGNNLLGTGAVNVGRVVVDNLKLDGNVLSSTSGDLDVTTATGGVFKFTNNAFQAGQDAANYLEIGHGGSNSFLNQVGAGGMEFRFAGTTKATFTAAGHLHLLTDTDQKHNLKIKTANNLNDSGIAWENSGGNFSQTIFRTDVGSNRSDLIFAIGSNANIDLLTASFKLHGSAANEGRFEILAEFQISSGSPGVNKVLTSDANGLATWGLQNSAAGWTDDGTIVRLTTISDKVGIGTADPQAQLEVGGTPGASVGGFASGNFHVTGQSALVNANAVITGHNLFGGNKQLWYLGSAASSSDDILFINRQNAALSLFTNNTERFKIEAGGAIVIGGVLTAGQLNADNLRLDGNVLSSVNANGDILVVPNGAGDLIILTEKVQVQGTSPAATGDNSELVEIRDNRTTTGDAPNYVFAVNRQNIGTAAWYFGNDGNGDAILAVNNRNLRFGRDLSGVFTEHMRIETGGNVGIGLTNPTEKLEVNGNIKVGIVIDETIYAQLNSSVNQNPTDTNPVVITYNTQDAISGLTHSTTVNPGEITIDTEGLYLVSPQPQVGKTTGGTKVDFDMFLQVDRGAGFVDEPNSNIKLTIKDSDITDVIVSVFTIELLVGDKIRMMQKTSNSAVGMGLKNTDPVTGPPSIPRTPSIIFTMNRVGGIP